MTYKIIETQYDKCDAHTRKVLMGLTLRGDSGMRLSIRNDKKTKIFILRNKEEILGWALHSFNSFYGWNWKGIGTMMFYIRKSYRKQGLGTTLLKHTINQCKKFRVSAYNEQVMNFFLKQQKSLAEATALEITKDYYVG